MLDLNIVPVVMGGGNYSRDAPEYSVINVKDFPSTKALADYLTYLTRNPVSDTNNYIRTAVPVFMVRIGYPKFGYPRVIPEPELNFGYGLGWVCV